MPGPYGVTSTGFVLKPLDQIASEIDTGLQSILGASSGTNSDGTIPLDTFAGQLKTLLADAFAAQWDIQQAIYSSFDPNSATGAAQDAVASITGTVRDPAAFSNTTATCTGTPGTVIPTGSVAVVTLTGSRFDSTAPGTITLLPSWTGLTVYTVSQRVKNASNCYVCIQSGTSAASGGPTTQLSSIADGSVVWQWLGAGTGAIDIPFQCEVAGAIGANAGTLSIIGSPIGGWSNVQNLLDVTLGALLESDLAFRIRRDSEVAADAAAIPNAIRAAVLGIVDAEDRCLVVDAKDRFLVVDAEDRGVRA